MKKLTIMVTILMAVFVLGCPDNSTDDSQDMALAAATALNGSNSGTGTGTGTGSSGTQPGTPPVVSSTTPTSGQVLTSSTTTVQVTFSRAMDTASVQSAFSVSDGTSNLGGTFAWTNGNATVTFTPTALTAWKVHTVTIAATAKASDNTAMSSSSSFTFRIGPFFTTTATGTLLWQSGNASTYSTNSWNWTGAKNYCAGYGMRLPTSSEWSNAYTGNASSLFSPGGGSGVYWTSNSNFAQTCAEVVYDNTSSIGFVTGGACGASGQDVTGNNKYVRCVL